MAVDPDQLKISTQHLLRFNGKAAKTDFEERNTDLTTNHWNNRFGGSSILHANKDGRLSPRGSQVDSMNKLIVVEDSEGAVPEKLRDSRRELTSRAELLG